VRLFLDSTFAIDHLRGDLAAVERFDRIFATGDDAFVNEIVVCEVTTGSSADDPELAAFLEALEFVQPGPQTALRAGRWRADARRRGFTLSLPDALIAATAESLGAAVLTRNSRDFSLTPVRIESY
jgi:predicted nucleic acid-binding protein